MAWTPDIKAETKVTNSNGKIVSALARGDAYTAIFYNPLPRAQTVWFCLVENGQYEAAYRSNVLHTVLSQAVSNASVLTITFTVPCCLASDSVVRIGLVDADPKSASANRTHGAGGRAFQVL